MAANAQTIQVGLQMTADTSQAKAQLQSLQTQLKNLMNTNLSGSSGFGITKEISEATSKVAQLKAQLATSTNSNGLLDLTAFNKSLINSGNSLSTYRKSLETLGTSGQSAFSKLTQSIVSASTPLTKTNGMLNGLVTNLAKVASWQLSSSIIHGFMSGISGAFNYAQQLNESLTNIRIVTGQSAEEMAEFATQANKAAQSLSTTTTAYTDAALIYYQQGLTGSDVTERTDVTMKLANVTGQTASEVSSYMTAIWNNFDDGSTSLEHFADVITNLGAHTASSSEEIAEGLGKFASVADTVGLSYDYATSALATVVAQTRQSADTVGTAFKTLFARMQDLELGDEGSVSLGTYAEALEKVGINVLDAEGKMLDMNSILDQMGEKWDTLSEAQQTALAQNVAGTRQYTQLEALMNNWDKFQENLDTANDSDGSLEKQQEIYAESWEAARDRVKAALQSIYSSLIDEKFFIGADNAITGVLGVVKDFIDALGGMKGVVLMISSLLLNSFGDKLAGGIDNIITRIQTMTGLTQRNAQALKEQAAAETEVMAKNAGGNSTATGSVLNGQLEIQRTLIKEADNLSEEQVKIYQTYLEQLDVLGQKAASLNEEIQSLQNNLSIQEKILASLIQQQAVQEAIKAVEESANGAILDQKINKLKEQKQEYVEIAEEAQRNNDTVLYEEAIKEIDKYIEKIKQAEAEKQKMVNEQLSKTSIIDEKSVASSAQMLGKLDQALKEVQNTETKSMSKDEFKNFRNSVKESIGSVQDLKKTLSSLNLNKDQINEIVKSFQNLGRKQSINGLKTGIEDLREKFASMLGLVEGSSGIFSNFSDEAKQKIQAIINQEISLGEKTEQSNNIIRETPAIVNAAGQAASSASQKMQSFGTTFSAAVSGITSLAFAIQSLQNLGSIWNDEDKSVGDKILSTIMSVGMALPMLTSAYNSLAQAKKYSLSASIEQQLNTQKEALENNELLLSKVALTDAEIEHAAVQAIEIEESSAEIGVDEAVAIATKKELAAKLQRNIQDSNWLAKAGYKIGLLNEEAFANGKVELSVWGVVKALAAQAAAWVAAHPIITGIAAAAAGIGLVVAAIVNYQSETEKMAETTSAAAKALGDTVSTTKDEANKLATLFDSYDSAVEKLEECTKGTSAWYDALKDVNEEMSEIISQYPELAKYVTTGENGALELNSEGQQVYQDKVNAVQQVELSAEATQAITSYKADNYTEKADQTKELNNFLLNDSEMTDLRVATGVSGAYNSNEQQDFLNLIEHYAGNSIDKASEQELTNALETIQNLTQEEIEALSQDENFDDYINNYKNVIGTDAEGNEIISGVQSFNAGIDEIVGILQSDTVNQGNTNGNGDNKSYSAEQIDVGYVEGQRELNQEIFNGMKGILLQGSEDFANATAEAQGYASEKLVSEYEKQYDEIASAGSIDDVVKKLKEQNKEVSDDVIQGWKDAEEETAGSGVEAAKEMYAQLMTIPEDITSYINQAQTEINGYLSDYTGTAKNIAKAIYEGGGVDFDITDIAGKELTGKELEGYQDRLDKYDDGNGNLTYSEDQRASVLGILEGMYGLEAGDLQQIADNLGIGIDELIQGLYDNTQALELTDSEQTVMDAADRAGVDSSEWTAEQRKNLSQAYFNADTDLDNDGKYNADTDVNKTNLMQQNLEAGTSVDDITDFFNALDGFDYTAADAAEKMQELEDQYHITGDEAAELVQKTGEIDKAYSLSTDEINATAKTLEDSFGSLKIGDAVASTATQQLDDLGIDSDQYFMTMSDGTRQLIGDAEDLQDAIDQITLDALEEKIQQITEGAKEQANRKTNEALGYNLSQDTTNEIIANSENNAANRRNSATEANYINGIEEDQVQQIIDSSDLDITLDRLSAIGEGEKASTEEMAEMNTIIEAINASLDGTKTQILSMADNVADLDQKWAEMQNNSSDGDENFQDYANALMNLATEQDNASEEIKKYQELIASGMDIENAVAESGLKMAVAAGEAAEMYDLEAEEVEDYAEILNDELLTGLENVEEQTIDLNGTEIDLSKSAKKLAKNQELVAEQAKDTSIAEKRIEKGTQALIDGWDDWSDTIKDVKSDMSSMGKLSNNTSREFSKIKDSVKSATKELLNMSDSEFSMLPDDFVEKNIGLIEDIKNGVDGAYDELSNKATQEMILSFKVSDESNAQLQAFNNTFDELQTKFADNPIELNAAINSDEFIAQANAIVAQAGLTAEQANAYFKSMGYDIEVTEDPSEIDTAVATDNDQYWVPATYEQNSPLKEGGSEESGSFETVSLVEAGHWEPVSSDKDLSSVKPAGYAIKAITPSGAGAGGNVSQKTAAGGGGNSGSGRRGGSGGGSGSTNRARRNTGTRKDNAASNRYYKVDKQISKLSKQYSTLSDARSKAYGKAALDAMDKEIAKNKQLIAQNEEKLNQAKEYLKTDAKKLFQSNTLTDVYDDDGNKLSGDASIKTILGKDQSYYTKNGYLDKEQLQNDLDAWYNKQLAQHEKTNEDNEAEKKRWAIIEAQYDQAKEAMDQYIETEDTIEDLQDTIWDTYTSNIDTAIEKVETLIDLTDEIHDSVESYLDFLVDATDDDPYDYATRIMAQAGKVQSAILSIRGAAKETAQYVSSALNASFGTATISSKTKKKIADAGTAVSNAIKSGDYQTAHDAIDKILRPKMEAEGKKANKDQETIDTEIEAQISKILNGSVTQELGSLENAQTILDAFDTAFEEVGNVMSEVNDQWDQLDSKISHATTMTENYVDILQTIGKVDKSFWNQDIAKTIGSNHYIQSTASLKMAQNELAYASSAYNAVKTMYDNGSKEEKEKLQEDLDEAYSKFQEAQENYTSTFDEGLQTTLEDFETVIEEISNDFSEAASGIAGSLDALSENFDMLKEVSDDYVDSYEKVYTLSKTLQDINTKINDTDNLKQKKQLKEFEEEINGYLESDAEMSEYDLDYLQKKYELLQAQMSLEEAQNAKSTVRMVRNANGGYGYVYTADSDKVEDAENEYRDKIYAMEEANEEYIDSLQENIENLYSTAQSKIAELAEKYGYGTEEFEKGKQEILSWFTSQNDFYSSEMDKVLGNNSTLYNDDISAYSKYTGDMTLKNSKLTESFADTELSAATGFENITEYASTAAEGFKTALNSMTDAVSELSAALNGLETLYNNGEFLTSGNIIASITDESSGATAAVNESESEDFQEKTYDALTGVLTKVSDWYKDNKTLMEEANNYMKVIYPQILKFQNQLATGDTAIADAVLKAAGISLDTGGYTGSWGSEGKIATLHEKELVLNADDTENILDAVSIMRDISSIIDANALASMGTFGSLSASGVDTPSQDFNQNVTISAEFPNATDRNEILSAFQNLQNMASQYANRF